MKIMSQHKKENCSIRNYNDLVSVKRIARELSWYYNDSAREIIKVRVLQTPPPAHPLLICHNKCKLYYMPWQTDIDYSFVGPFSLSKLKSYYFLFPFHDAPSDSFSFPISLWTVAVCAWFSPFLSLSSLYLTQRMVNLQKKKKLFNFCLGSKGKCFLDLKLRFPFIWSFSRYFPSLSLPLKA